MRGKSDPQSILFIAAIDLDQRIRSDHALRAIKQMADDDLRKMDRRFEAAYADEGRPSIPPRASDQGDAPSVALLGLHAIQ